VDVASLTSRASGRLSEISIYTCMPYTLEALHLVGVPNGDFFQPVWL